MNNQKKNSHTVVVPQEIRDAPPAVAESAAKSYSTELDNPKLPDHYEVLEKVSEGGMGVIFKARNRFTGGKAAVKFLHKELSQDAESLKRFAFEARAAAVLEHPNIIRIYDFGVNEDHVPYIIMDWVDGIGLSRKIKRDGPLEVREGVFVISQVANALAHAHRHKVIHRDLKPENLMLTRDHEGNTAVRVVDFGIAKSLTGSELDSHTPQNLTQTGTIIGSPYYMSPEQGLGRPTDERSDIYSLGCVMYFVLTGKLPYEGINFMETIFQHVNGTIPRLDEHGAFPVELEAIVSQALAKEPEERYQTMDEFAEDLSNYLNGHVVQAVVAPKRGSNLIAHAKVIGIFMASFVVFYVLVSAVQMVLGR